MNASFGALSGVTIEVTHRIPSPGSGLVAVQPAGNAGAVTASKFSAKGGPALALGDAAAVAVAVAVGVGVPPPAVAVAVAVGVADGIAVPLGVGVGTGAPVPRL